MNPLFADQPTSIFEHMSGLARTLGAINLGQGFPDFGWPEDVVAKAAEALATGSNQYPPMRGIPELREAVARYYRRRQSLDVELDQVTITSGATEANNSLIYHHSLDASGEVWVSAIEHPSLLQAAARSGWVTHLMNFKAASCCAGDDFLKT